MAWTHLDPEHEKASLGVTTRSEWERSQMKVSRGTRSSHSEPCTEPEGKAPSGVSMEDLRLIRRIINLLEVRAPQLFPGDSCALTMLAYGRVLASRHMPKNKPVDFPLLGNLQGIALQAVVMADPPAARSAGI